MQGIKITPHTAQIFSGPKIYSKSDYDIAELYDEKTLPTDVYLKMLRHQTMGLQNDENQILPLNCRYFYHHPVTNRKLYVIEQPPAFRTIFSSVNIKGTVEKLKQKRVFEKWGYKNFKIEDKPHKFMLAFPYIIYLIQLNQNNSFAGLSVFCRNTPIRSKADYICKIPLSNIDTTQHVCMGEIPYEYSAIENVESIIKAFWQNEFNNDYIYNIQAYLTDPYVCDFLTWQYMSKLDPMFIYKVNWINWEMTLGQEINKYKSKIDEHAKENLNNDITWTKMVKAFQKHVETNIIDAKTDSEVIHNISDSTFLSDGIIAYHGDSFNILGKRYFIEDFRGSAETMEVEKVLLRREDGKKFSMRLTRLTEKFLTEKIVEARHITKFIFDGTEIKRGDIISMYIRGVGEITRKVEYFRYALDGQLEMKTNSNFLIVNSITDITIINLDAIEINGMILKEGEKYLITPSTENSGYTRILNRSNFMPLHRATYTGVDISTESGNTIVLKFITDGGTTITHEYNNYKSTLNILNKDEAVPFPPVFRNMNRLFYYECTVEGSYPCYDVDGSIMFVEETAYKKPFSEVRFNEDILDKLLIGNSFVLRGCGHDMIFSIGDKVVVSDWVNPLEMFKVKTIVGFARSNYEFKFVFEDKHGNVTEKRILRHEPDSNYIAVSFNEVRPVVTEYEGIKSGSKIKATEVGIPNFPKKDTNIIVAFITDTKVPLVLCSNGCTLWFDDMMEKFEIISEDNTRHRRLRHAPLDLNKIKPQGGDLMNLNGSLYTIIGDTYYMNKDGGLYIHSVADYGDRGSTFHMDSYYQSISRFHGILSPRFKKSDLDGFPFRSNVTPNFNGEFVRRNISRFRTRFDPRRVINDK